MIGSVDPDLRIRIDAEASPEEVRAVAEVFRAFGMEGPVEASSEARPVAYTGEGNGTDWIVQVLLLGSTVGAFLTGYSAPLARPPGARRRIG